MYGTSFSSHGLGSYVGERKHGVIEGAGTYYFDTGTVYQGEFKDGMFHGQGTLYFTNGGRYDATWAFGREVTGSYEFSDGLKFNPNNDPLSGWKYCNKIWDRRFYPEIIHGLRPADLSMMSPHCDDKGKPTRHIPANCYDPGNGFYDPGTRIIYKYRDEKSSGKSTSKLKHDTFIRSTTTSEHDWVTENCRKGTDEFVGSQRITNYDDDMRRAKQSGKQAMKKLGSYLLDREDSEEKRSDSHLPLIDFKGSDIGLRQTRSLSASKSSKE